MATSKVLSLFEYLSARNEPPGEAQPGLSHNAPEPTLTRNDAPGDVTHTDTRQDAPGCITGQSTQPGEADAGAFPAGESSPATKFEPDVDGSIANLLRQAASRASSAPQNVPKGTTAQSTLPDKAASQPDDAVRLRARIDDCLITEPDPALRLLLERLHRDSYSYPAEFVRQELEAYLQASSPDDFLNRLAVLHLSWALDDVAADPDGKRLVRGDTGERKAILEAIEAIRKAFEQETQPVLRTYLAGLARRALTNPVYARERLDDYTNKREDATWQWLAEVAVAGSPEAAFQWRLQEARRKTADARLLGYLDKLEQEARESLPMAASKLEAFIEILALLDNPTYTTPAQNAPETLISANAVA